MSMPTCFQNSETYFDSVLEFLCTYSWIYRKANVACIATIDIMPIEFKTYFFKISNDKLNAFPFFGKNIDDCPSEVRSFRQKLDFLTPKYSLPKTFEIAKMPRNQLGISAKKIQEIKQFAAHIYDHCADVQVVVDLGAGLGYLSQAFYELKPNCIILGLEANMARVESARQRCLRLLPQNSEKSIKYQQKLINADSEAYIIEQTSELADKNGCPELNIISMIGLHACADLSINAMRLFLKMPRVHCLHIMPCCYHKLDVVSHDEDTDAIVFANFPLSAALGKSVKKCLTPPFLNRPFLRLACQRSSFHWWRNSTEGAHKEHGDRLYMRAMAEAIHQSNEFVKPRKNAVPTPNSQINFFELKRGFQLLEKGTGLSVEWKPSHEVRFLEISARYTNGEGPKLAEGLTCLQVAMQQLCENVVLFDRLCYLQEEAENKKVPVKVRYDVLFDKKISPRCHVMVAEKL
ncbi:hypothetical protein KR084_007998 [Drosophila pseudotakahashii]|nr:hypothetical protein KR084_007998 [Drosophila pseudotakahashii]